MKRTLLLTLSALIALAAPSYADGLLSSGLGAVNLGTALDVACYPATGTTVGDGGAITCKIGGITSGGGAAQTNFQTSGGSSITPATQTSGSSQAASSLGFYSSSSSAGGAPYIFAAHATNGGAVSTSDNLGNLMFEGSDGTSLLPGCGFKSFAGATATTGSLLAYMDLYCNPGGSSVSAMGALTPTGIGIGAINNGVQASFESEISFTSTTAATWTITNTTGSQTVGTTSGLTVGATYAFVLAPNTANQEYAFGTVTSSTAINFTARARFGSSAVSQSNGVTLTALHIIAAPSDTTTPKFWVDTAGNTFLGGPTTIAGVAKYTGTIPTATGTGTPTVTTGSTDNAGSVTAGATATSIVITSGNTGYVTPPFCVVAPVTQLVAFSAPVTVSAGHFVITVTQTATSGNLITWQCSKNT